MTCDVLVNDSENNKMLDRDKQVFKYEWAKAEGAPEPIPLRKDQFPQDFSYFVGDDAVNAPHVCSAWSGITVAAVTA